MPEDKTIRFFEGVKNVLPGIGFIENQIRIYSKESCATPTGTASASAYNMRGGVHLGINTYMRSNDIMLSTNGIKYF